MIDRRKTYNYQTEEVDRLLKETSLKYTEIQRLTGCPYSTVIYKARKMKRKTKSEDTTLKQLPKQTLNKAKVNAEQSDNLKNVLCFQKNNVDLEEATKVIRDMINSARILGENKVDITITSVDEVQQQNTVI
ncbi:hypothetical protein GLW00_20100 [Halobacillus litoralis]|uniref:Uncharacterized protein n=1 Tax=Halobacillus litoralis TaxID=45668 RepID=A0A845FF06_9BACI|nr:hypothetical protein [Halobacillus litoralis]MYL73122.1 hypothetical protein [Halobacillus litoralis]